MPLSDSFLREIGRVTVNFATLEVYLSLAIGGLIGPDAAIGQIVTSESPFRNKLSLFSSLVRHKIHELPKATEEWLPELENLLTRLRTCEEERNQIAHSVWLLASEEVADEATRFKITSKQRKGLQHATEPVTVVHLKTIADNIRKTSESIMPFLFKHFENAPPSGAA